MSMHSGHRERVKKRYLQEGLDSFSEIQVLELLLFYCLPRVDTNPIAHRLLEHFGGFWQVLDASVEDLAKVEGVGEKAATFLHIVRDAGRFYQVSRSSQAKELLNLESCAEYLLPFFHGRSVEMVYLLCMDARCRVLCCKKMEEGSVNSTTISIRKIVAAALAVNASSVVLAHNHPSGLAITSQEDLQITRQVAMALQAVEITLADHVIVADGDYVSLAVSEPKYQQYLMV